MAKKQVFTIVLCCCALLLSAVKSTAQRPDAPLYAQTGPYAVGTQDFIIDDVSRPLTVTVWYPANAPDEQQENAVYSSGLLLRLNGEKAYIGLSPALENKPYPLVLFSHGSGGFRFQSIFLTEHLASYGFVVMAVDHVGNTVIDTLQPANFGTGIISNYAHRPQDMLRMIAFAETLNAENGPLNGLIDLEKIAVSGHSFGGYTALATAGGRINFDALNHWCTANQNGPLDNEKLSYTVCFLQNAADQVAALRGLDQPPIGLWQATTDSRVRAVVALAPWNGPIYGEGGLAEINIPALVIVGSTDTITPAERDAFAIYENLASEEKTLVTLQNADHYIFVQKCWELALRFGFFGSCSDSVWDMDRAHDLINHFTTAFLLSTLKNDAAAAQALRPDAVDFRGVIYTTTK